ncbi:hypothetical protein FPK44_20890, partial [Acinetobacter baumannii]|nr:hypothetical protein [Acinetobacter baumannii]
MAKISITDLKQSITTLNVPVKKTVIWNVEVTESNVASLKKLTKNSLLELGETVELEADVFVKKMSFKESREVSKAVEWEFNYKNPEDSKVKRVDSTLM